MSPETYLSEDIPNREELEFRITRLSDRVAALSEIYIEEVDPYGLSNKERCRILSERLDQLKDLYVQHYGEQE